MVHAAPRDEARERKIFNVVTALFLTSHTTKNGQTCIRSVRPQTQAPCGFGQTGQNGQVFRPDFPAKIFYFSHQFYKSVQSVQTLQNKGFGVDRLRTEWTD